MARISLVFLLLAARTVFPAALPFQPSQVEFSSTLNRVVAVAPPSSLYLYNPANGESTQVSLASTPLGLSLSPDGRYAAVGHDGSVTYVNLTTAQVVRTFNVPAPASNVVLAANWIYVLARLDSPSGNSYSINIATGDITTSEVGRVQSGARLHPDNITIYAGRGADWVPLDISLGPVRTTSLQASNGACTALSYSPDGRRLYSSCSRVSQFSFGTNGPLELLGRFPNESGVRVAESAALQLAARVSSAASNQVRLYHTASLQERGSIVLAEDRIVTHVFFSPAGTTLYVASITPADAAFLDAFDLTSATSCATPAATSATLPGAGGLIATAVTVPVGCVFRATTDAPWIQLISGITGNSDSTLQFHAGPNPAGSPRTGTVRVGTQAITVTQQGSALPNLQTPQPISFPVSGADYSKTLNRLVLVSAQVRELRVLDPITGASLTVPFERTPLSVAVSPDGLRAAVGQPGRVSVVNLQTGAIERNTGTPDFGNEVAYAGNNYVYSTPHQDLSLQNSQLYSTLPDQGTTVTLQIPGGQRGLRLHPNNGRLYVGSPNRGRYSRFDVRSGVAAAADPVKSVANCGNLWFSEDGSQLFTACGTVHQASADFAQDGTLLGSLAGAGSQVEWVANSALQRLTAVIPSTQANTVQFYNNSRALATQRSLGTVGGQPTAGRYAFWSASGDRLIVLSQVDANWLAEVIDINALTSCNITLSPTTVSIDANGGSGSINVSTFGPCAWQARSNASWITLAATSGSGAGTISFIVEPNRNGARSGTIEVGGIVATVQQAAGAGVTVTGSPTRFPVTGGSGSINVQTGASGQAWTAVTTVPWILITSGQTGSGNGTISFQVMSHSGSLTRSGAIRIGGVDYNVYQSGLDPGLRFVPITPCRVVDTRGEPGLTAPFSTPAISGGAERAFPIAQGRCGIPANVRAYAMNVTVVPNAALSFLSIYPTGAARPLVSTLNSFNGAIKANAAIVPAGADGSVSVFVTDTTEVILDINGYFVPATSTNVQTTLAYSPLGACRLLDTRQTTSLAAGETRILPLRTTLNACGSIGANARAYNLNVTVIPKNGRVSFVTLWPSNAERPVVSTLNSPLGNIVANAAIIPAGPDGAIQVFTTDPADILIDISGTFVPESGDGRYHLYPVTPCRVADTRNGPGPFGGPTMTPSETRSFPLASGGCAVPSDPNIPRVYVLGATVVPQGPLSYLTLFSTSGQQPFVSTLNAFDGAVTSNLALVTGGAGGAVSAFVTDRTDLVLDVSGFFAVP